MSKEIAKSVRICQSMADLDAFKEVFQPTDLKSLMEALFFEAEDRPHFDEVRKRYVHPDGSADEVSVETMLFLSYIADFCEIDYTYAKLIRAYKDFAVTSKLNRDNPYAKSYPQSCRVNLRNWDVSRGLEHFDTPADLAVFCTQFKRPPKGNKAEHLFIAAVCNATGVEIQYHPIRELVARTVGEDVVFGNINNSFNDEVYKFVEKVNSILGTKLDFTTMKQAIIQVGRRNKARK